MKEVVFEIEPYTYIIGFTHYNLKNQYPDLPDLLMFKADITRINTIDGTEEKFYQLFYQSRGCCLKSY